MVYLMLGVLINNHNKYMDNCLECGRSVVRDYKCRHDCDMCKDCDPEE